MHFKTITLSIICAANFVNAGYFVQLKAPSTLESLLATDDKISAVNHLRPYVRKAFSFGNFEAFSGNFTKDVVQRLARNPLVAEIVPDLVVNAFDEDSISTRKRKKMLNIGFKNQKTISDSPHVSHDLKHNHEINHMEDEMLTCEVDDMYDVFKSNVNDNSMCLSGFIDKKLSEALKYFFQETSGDKKPYETEIDAPFQIQEISGDEKPYETQMDAPRHLARLSRHSRLPLNESVNYYYDSKFKGQGVNAYIIDTGILKEHPEFENRAIFGADFTNEGSGDMNGHGTHVAGIIGSKTFGVAKDVTLVEVKALDKLGQGSLTTVIAALEFAVNHRRENNVMGVANLSLGAIKNTILNQAIEAAVQSGLLVVVAAGNSNIDACLTSPASSSYAITVGAIDDRSDSIASFSNWGECVNVFSSGVLVNSVNINDFDEPLSLSGTSMSSPSVTGLSSILLQLGIPVREVGNKIVELSSKGFINKRSLIYRPFSPNRIANNGIDKDDDEYPESKIPKDDEVFDNNPGRSKNGDPLNEGLGFGDQNDKALDPQRVGELDLNMDKLMDSNFGNDMDKEPEKDPNPMGFKL